METIEMPSTGLRDSEIKAKTWTIDPLHSEIQFKVKHLVISTVTGTFKTFSGDVTSQTGSFENSNIQFKIDVNSIDTNQSQRDEHLKSDDFFSASKYPEVTFQSTSFLLSNEFPLNVDYKLVGNLTMKGVTKPIKLDVSFGGSAKDSYGNTKYGFEITGIVNRKEFGLTYNALTEAGGLALGEDIKIIANIQIS